MKKEDTRERLGDREGLTQIQNIYPILPSANSLSGYMTSRRVHGFATMIKACYMLHIANEILSNAVFKLRNKKIKFSEFFNSQDVYFDVLLLPLVIN